MCGTKDKPVDCYMKSAQPSPRFWDQRVSGVPGPGCRPTYPLGPPPPSTAWRFFNLVEDGEGGVLARLPDYGSGYLSELGCSNSNTRLTCPAGVLPASLSVTDSSVYVNLGADWFTETRPVTSASATEVQFASGAAGFGANSRIYLQGDKALISHAGEWALDSREGLLYYWPRDQVAMASGQLHVLATSTTRVLDIRGEGWSAGQLATGIDVDGIVFSGSDFSASYTLFSPDRSNDTPFPLREGMVRLENASDVTVANCAMMDAGHSAVWLAGFAQNLTFRGNWIERPGFCGFYLNGM